MIDLARAISSILRPKTKDVTTTQEATGRASKRAAALLAITGLFSSTVIVAADVAGTASTDFQIPAASLADALSKFGAQSGMQVVYAPDLARGLKSEAVAGKLTADAALKQLLDGTGLTWSYVNGNTVVLKRSATETSTAKKNSDEPKPTQGLEEITVTAAIPEILVVGSRSLNADIQRTEDDPQPYVVFDREQIERSMSNSVGDFLKTRLPMNAVRTTDSQNAGSGNQSSINLRGLGTNQTLILVDGRRMPNINSFGTFIQPDINGIPLAAIERIEVLPSTASGIYGGGATGGVVNVITRRDYSGVDVAATYGNTFDTDAGSMRFDASAGFSLEDGRTQVLVAASHAESEPLHVGERDFASRARSLQQANNPSAFLTNFVPPLSYTSNIRSQDGSNLVLDDSTPLNSPRTFVPIGYQGPTSDGGAALVANAGQYNLALPDDLLGSKQNLLNNPTVDSMSANLRRAFGARVDAFIDLSWFDNQGHSDFAITPQFVTLPANAPNNPFTTAINVSFPSSGLSFSQDFESETVRAAGGVIVRLSQSWTAGADYVWSRARTENIRTSPTVGDPDGAGPGISVDTALANGTLNVMRDLNISPLDYSPYFLPSPNSFMGPSDTTLKDATLRLSGPLFHLPAGPLTLSGLVQWREEEAEDTFEDSMSSTGVTSAFLNPRRSQSVVSYYLETRVPLLPKDSSNPLLRGLELQASVRHDDYETEQPRPSAVALASRTSPRPTLTYFTNDMQATKYTVGMRYAPIRDIAVRGSFGTGFLPPSINQIVPSLPTSRVLTLTDPKRGGATAAVGPITVVGNGNPELEPEESESWSAGIIFTPRFLPDLRVSVDYTRIEKTDEIANLGQQGILNFEDYFPGRVTRAPLTAGDIALGYTGGAITGLDFSLVNIAAARIEAYDFQIDYVYRTERMGEFHVYTVATWQPRLERQTVPTSSFLDSAGYDGGPLEWRGNAGLTWTRGSLSVDWNMQYYDSYVAYFAGATQATVDSTILNQGSANIPHQTYHDLFMRYRFGESLIGMGRMLTNTEILFGIQNVFDESPPILATTASTGGYSGYGDPRLRRFSITLRKRF